jgi:hypothetical protein
VEAAASSAAGAAAAVAATHTTNTSSSGHHHLKTTTTTTTTAVAEAASSVAGAVEVEVSNTASSSSGVPLLPLKTTVEAASSAAGAVEVDGSMEEVEVVVEAMAVSDTHHGSNRAEVEEEEGTTTMEGRRQRREGTARGDPLRTSDSRPPPSPSSLPGSVVSLPLCTVRVMAWLTSASLWLTVRARVCSLLIDAIGFATYAIPVLGEAGDAVWAPISGFLIYLLYGNIWLAGAGYAFPIPLCFQLCLCLTHVNSFIEEMMPGLDFIPTATVGTNGHNLRSFFAFSSFFVL